MIVTLMEIVTEYLVVELRIRNICISFALFCCSRDIFEKEKLRRKNIIPATRKPYLSIEDKGILFFVTGLVCSSKMPEIRGS